MNTWMYSIVFLLCSSVVMGQNSWSHTKLKNLPIPSSDNAVCESVLPNGTKYVYSFGGVTNPLAESNIHRRVQKYTIVNNSWSLLGSIPDSLGKIGASASFVNNRIYLIGGHYSVNDSLISSNQVHVFNPFVDSFEVNAVGVPIAVDHHVQDVWRDSLIYVIGGWSNEGTTPKVHVFNPFFNTWSEATSLPDNDFFKVYGASGVILGDTIFYYGGISEGIGTNVSSGLRKGVIDPEDPTQIEWTYVAGYNIPVYKGVAGGHGNKMFVFGGSEYEFDFSGNVEEMAVPPFIKNEILNFSISSGIFSLSEQVDFSISRKGSRGAAKLGGGNWLICGGIDSLQRASRDVFLLTNFAFSDIDKALKPPLFDVVEFDEYYLIRTENVGNVAVYDIAGRVLFSERKNLADMHILKSDLHAEMLIFVYNDGSNVPVTRKRVLIR